MLLPANTPIANVIVGEIKQTGPISLARFMDLALYHPDLGYYERRPDSIGKAGDYFTSVSTGALFGALLASRFAHCLQRLPGHHEGYTLLEAGAHDGQLALDILTRLENSQTALFHDITYQIVEPSPRRRLWQQRRLERFADKTCWHSSWEEIPRRGLVGIVFANELMDAFPAHRFRWNSRRSEWEEWGIDYQDQGLVWRPLSGVQSPVPHLPDALLDLLTEGYCLETCPTAIRWWRQAARSLNQGFLLTVDYGYLDDEWWGRSRPNGSLRAIRNHTLQGDPLHFPGDCDLTADVNFSRLIEAGEAEGLSTRLLTTQGRWLSGIASTLIQPGQTNADWSPSERRQFQTLTHPQQLGERFRVLAQATPDVPERPAQSL